MCGGFRVLCTLFILPCLALSLSTRSSSPRRENIERSTASIVDVSQSALAVFDAAEWVSVQVVLKQEGQKTRPSQYGRMVVVTGREEGSNRRIVAMQSSESPKLVYTDTIAQIPEGVSDEDALSTFMIGMTSIHCALPQTKNIAGGSDSIIAGKTVILGGNAVACFAAQGLSSMGINVSLVSSKVTSISNKAIRGSRKCQSAFLMFGAHRMSFKRSAPYNNMFIVTIVRKVRILKPGDCEEGFALEVGQFDSMLDTANDERPSFLFGDMRDLDESDESMDLGTVGGTLGLLESRHGCHR
jgi:hypothetical protein